MGEHNYPDRSMAPRWARYLCMGFGLFVVLGGVFSAPRQPDLFMLVTSVLVGGTWFAFGKYGGLPLVETVARWQPPTVLTEITSVQRQGLVVMRRRKWTMWAAIPATLGLAALLVAFEPVGRPEMILLVAAVPIAFINFRYLLSRCPRCGYGFFTRSRSRAAPLHLASVCGHCGLSLHAY